MDFQEFLSQNGARLTVTLNDFNNRLTASRKGDPNEACDLESIFCNLIIDQMIERSVLPIPLHGQLNEGEYLEEHKIEAKIGRGQVKIWGSALLGNADAGWQVHLFTTDFARRGQLEELTTEECQRLTRQALRFFSIAVDGNAEKALSPRHKAQPCIRRLLSVLPQINAIRIWIFSNRIKRGNNTGRLTTVVCDRNYEVTTQIADLQYFSTLFSTGEVTINQSFADIGGIPCITHPAINGQDYVCHQAAIPGKHLAELYSMHGTALVQSNVRAYLGDKRSVNKSIFHTAETEPCRFLAYNNGLVISANDVVIENDRIVEMNGIQIINGGQTTASLHQYFLSSVKKRDELISWAILDNLSRLLVPAKVIVPIPELNDAERAALRERISEAANTQNAVRSSDLASNHPFQIDFSAKLNGMPTPDSKFWFYERSVGLHTAEKLKNKGDKAATRRFNLLYPEDKVFGKTDLALAILAWEGKAQICAKGKEVAFAAFSERFSKSEYRTLTNAEVQNMVCKWILFKDLEKGTRNNKDLGISNPRAPVCYAISLFAENWGDRVRWDYVWNRQEWSPGFMMIMYDIIAVVHQIMRRNMGNSMISMWARQPACWETIRSEFDPEAFDFDNTYEMS